MNRGLIMRLGECRSNLRRFDNKLKVKLSVYEEINTGIYDLEIDIVNEDSVYLRAINKE